MNIFDFEEYIQPKIIENIKNKHEFRPFRAKKMTISYMYKDKYDNLILKISVAPEQYMQNKKNEEVNKNINSEK